MREIKFRAWDTERKIYVSQGDIIFKFYGETYFEVLPNQIEYIGDRCLNGEPQSNRFILEQYTGLKDKNGSGDICLFEGDILSLSGNLIGNIYENEELLKDKTNIVIKRIGTKDWRSSEKEAMDRGWGYAF